MGVLTQEILLFMLRMKGVILVSGFMFGVELSMDIMTLLQYQIGDPPGYTLTLHTL